MQPKLFRHSVTIVLQKPNKGDYTKAGAYRLIALLNIIAKTLEALVATRLIKEAKRRGLFPLNQMEARPGRSTISALQLVVEQI